MRFGHTSHPGVLAALVMQARTALASVPERPWQRSALGQRDAGTPVLGGGLAIALDPRAGKGLIWLRPELRQVVLWGGNPHEPATLTHHSDGSTTISAWRGCPQMPIGKPTRSTASPSLKQAVWAPWAWNSQP